jgi:hypothetical protein
MKIKAKCGKKPVDEKSGKCYPSAAFNRIRAKYQIKAERGGSMNEEKDNVLKDFLTEEQMRALLELERTTHKSVTSMIREGIEMYLRLKKAETVHITEPAIFSPMVFDRPYRKMSEES